MDIRGTVEMSDIREKLKGIAEGIASGAALSNDDSAVLSSVMDAASADVPKEIIAVVVAILNRIHGSSHGASMLGGHDLLLRTTLETEAKTLQLSSALAGWRPKRTGTS